MLNVLHGTINGNNKPSYLTVFLGFLFRKLTLITMFQILPLYKELHAYVRAKLQDVYPGRITSDAYLPAHLLGNKRNVTFWTLHCPNRDIKSHIQE